MEISTFDAQSLYRSLIGSNPNPRTYAAKMAAQIENDLRVGTMPPPPWTERTLSRCYRVSQEVAREGLRILAARHVVEMKRGRGGGMRPMVANIVPVSHEIAAFTRRTRLEPCHLIDAVEVSRRIVRSIFLASGGSASCLADKYMEIIDKQKAVSDIIAAENAFFSEMAGLSNNPMSSLASGTVSALTTALITPDMSQNAPLFADMAKRACAEATNSSSDSEYTISDLSGTIRALLAGRPARAGLSEFEVAADTPGETAASILANDILADHAAGDLGDASRVGSNLSFMDKYGASRRVVQQAIRILEDAGMATARPGRGNGLMIIASNISGLERQIFSYFSVNQFTPEQNAAFLSRLMSAQTWVVAQRVTDETRVYLAMGLRKIAEDMEQDDVLSALKHYVEAQRAVHANPVLTTFSYSLVAYWARACPDRVSLSREQRQRYIGGWAGILRALANGNASQALDLQRNAIHYMFSRTTSIGRA